MKAKMLMLAAALLVFAATGFGQGFVTVVYYMEGPALTTTCNGGVPIPDGTMYYLHQDLDGDGADLDDPLATACYAPPECLTGGESGSLNWTSLPMNGEAMLGAAGYFYPEYAFISQGALPTVNRFFIKVSYDTPGVRTVWMSNVFSPAVGLSEIPVASFTCTTITTTPPCEQPTGVVITPTTQEPNVEQDVPGCVNLCSNATYWTHVCIGPVVRENRYPIVHVEAACGCADGSAGEVVWQYDTWQYMEMNGAWYYCNNLMLANGAAEGCVTVVLDHLLPAEMGNIAVTPRDAEVEVVFNTLSETSVNKFVVRRDNANVAELAAVGGTSGAEYRYVDENLQNGRTYKYELVLVNMDGSSEVVATESVTPSSDLAVITEYALGQNYPNPFNPSTTISFDVKETNPVTLTVYNATGQLVATLMNNVTHNNGRYSLTFDATNLTSGLYFYTVKIGNEFTSTKKMLLVK